MELSQQEWDAWIDHATNRPSFTPTQRAAMRKAMSILGQPSMVLLMRKSGLITYSDASAILSIPVSSVQEAEKVAVRRLSVITSILMLDCSTVPDLYHAVPEKPEYSYMRVLDSWIRSLNVCTVAEEIGVGRTTATAIMSRLRLMLLPHGLDKQLKPDRSIAIQRKPTHEKDNEERASFQATA